MTEILPELLPCPFGGKIGVYIKKGECQINSDALPLLATHIHKAKTGAEAFTHAAKQWNTRPAGEPLEGMLERARSIWRI